MRAPPIKLPEPLDRLLTALAKKRHSRRAMVLREALATLDKRSAAPTASELATDLVFEGPPDLSTNPKHMTGYGLQNRPAQEERSRPPGRKSLPKLFAESPLKGLELKCDRD
jgi:hypothetical protein